jgi:type III secretory pathway component EscS
MRTETALLVAPIATALVVQVVASLVGLMHPARNVGVLLVSLVSWVVAFILGLVFEVGRHFTFLADLHLPYPWVFFAAGCLFSLPLWIGLMIVAFAPRFRNRKV